MANETITQLPTVSSAQLTDIIYAVQGYVSPSSPGTSVQETLQQVFNLISSGVIQSHAGNPNGSVAGTTYNLCWDTTDSLLYVCTTSGTTLTAVWTKIGGNLIPPSQGGTGVSNPTAHAIPIAEGSSNYNFLTLTNNQVLLGVTGSDPSPTTLTAGTGISLSTGGGNLTITNTEAGGLVSPTFGGTGVSNPTAHGVAVAEGASNFNFFPLSNMQVLLGATGADPAAATIVAGTGINITYSGGNLTFTNTEAGGLVFPAFGGTGVSNPTAHGIAVAEGSNNFNFLTLTNQQVLLGSTGNDPIPTTITAGTGISITNAGGNLTFTNTEAGGLVSPTFGGTGVSNPTAHAIPIAEGASNFNLVTLSNNQVLLGVTSADPTPTTIAAGVGISIVNSGGNLTFSATGEGKFSWNHVTGTSQGMLSENGYVADNVSRVNLSLPVTSGFGDEIKIVGYGTGGWMISQGAGQEIFVGSLSTTAGAGGSIASTDENDSISLVCIIANTVWSCVGSPLGNLTIV